MGVDENNYEEKKMGVGRIVDQNSDKKDGCTVLIMLNSRLGFKFKFN